MPWASWASGYDLVRDAIAKVIPGCDDYNRRVRLEGGFYLPNGPRHRQFPTADGKAHFVVNAIPEVRPGWTPPADHLILTSVRSHDQFNTTIYGLNDRYRGIYRDRRVIMMSDEDLAARGIAPQQTVVITGHAPDGIARQLRDYTAVVYPVPKGCAVMYYPEANALIPIDATDEKSNCPSFKNTVITVEKA